MAGETTIRLTRSVQFGVGTVGGIVETVTPDTTNYFQQTFGVVSNIAIPMVVTLSTALIIAISADKDCTLETNNASTPDDTLTLKANQPLIFRSGSGDTNFLTEDVTSFFITTSVANTTIKIGVGANLAA
jgi:LytS/YehU family sensor histidine kinase